MPKGIDKPYFDKNGVIWLKCGADKRRINSKEELRRFFQFADQFHADELPTKAGLDRLDSARLAAYLRDVYKQEFPKSHADRLRILQNMNLASDAGTLNLAGVLLFAKEPERIEIVSPGHLPNNLTVEKIRTGNSNIRNPILASYAAKGILPYHGIGSGIKRALDDWPDIRFADDRDGCIFTATVQRKEVRRSLKSSLKRSLKRSGKSSGKTDAEILHMLSENPHMTIPEMAASLRITTRGVRKQIANLKQQGRLRRIGPDKGGHWETMDRNEG